MKKILKIALCSDLCAGNGSSDGTVVDREICLDRYGVPYIPARRIKGILREEAQKLIDFGVLNSKDIEALFGKACTGKDSIKINDAYLFGEKELGKMLVNRSFSPEEIKAAFSRVRAQTALDENGCADEKSLRFTRVVNQYIGAPDARQCVFEAVISFDDSFKEALEKTVMALRHIGINRTRGLGVVNCTLEDYHGNHNCEITDTVTNPSKVIFKYFVRLNAPVTAADNSLHIDGSTVIGMFAGEYLKRNGTAVDERFNRLFLNSSVCWSPLYPVICQNGEFADAKISYPAPMFIRKTKYDDKGERKKEYVNCMSKSISPERQLSGISGIYCTQTENGYVIAEPETEFFYHHSQNTSDPLLYSQRGIAREQVYGGTVICGKEDYELVKAVLKSTDIHLGKSRSAQYSSCEMIYFSCENYESEKVKIAKGEMFCVVSKTDFIPYNTGVMNCCIGDTQKYISGALSISDISPDDDNSSICAYKTVSGFNTVWMLQKPSHKAICAGSVFTFIAGDDYTLDRTVTLGAGSREGYGVFEIVKKSELENLSLVTQADVYKTDNAVNDASTVTWAANSINRNRVIKDVRNTAYIFFSDNKKSLVSFTASFIGRLNQMLKESTSGNDFINRVNTIKDEKKKALFIRLLDKLSGKTNLSRETHFDNLKIALTDIFALTKYSLRTEKKEMKS